MSHSPSHIVMRCLRLGLALVLAVVLVAPAAQAAGLGEFFKVCSRSDPKLNECVVESLNGAKGNMVKGIPSLGLVPLDPVTIREMRFEEGPAEFQLRMELRNCSMVGLANFTAVRAKVDLPERYIEVKIIVPRLVLSGRYSVDGHMLTLHLRGNGPCVSIFDNVNVTNRIKFAEDMKDGVLYWKAVEDQWEVDMEELKVNYGNLFGGNKLLGRYTNDFMNRHWRPLYRAYKYLLTESFGKIFLDITNNMIDKVSFDEMFKP